MLDTTQFRPKDTSSDAARQAALAAGIALATAKETLVAAREARDAQLLDGGAKTREKSHVEFTAARDQVELIEAVIVQLKARIESAVREEVVGAVTTRLQEVDTAILSANAFAETKGPALSGLLREATGIAGELDKSRALLRTARNRAYQNYLDDPRVAAGTDGPSLSTAVEDLARALRDARAPQ